MNTKTGEAIGANVFGIAPETLRLATKAVVSAKSDSALLVDVLKDAGLVAHRQAQVIHAMQLACFVEAVEIGCEFNDLTVKTAAAQWSTFLRYCALGGTFFSESE